MGQMVDHVVESAETGSEVPKYQPEPDNHKPVPTAAYSDPTPPPLLSLPTPDLLAFLPPADPLLDEKIMKRLIRSGHRRQDSHAVDLADPGQDLDAAMLGHLGHGQHRGDMQESASQNSCCQPDPFDPQAPETFDNESHRQPLLSMRNSGSACTVPVVTAALGRP